MSVQKPLPHDAAPLHVTGAARYVDDIPVPADCLHLAFGLSKVANGRITAWTFGRRAPPGVVTSSSPAPISRRSPTLPLGP
jgi:xanthine dehydrogenase large subunit